MKVDVKNRIQVIMLPAKTFSLKELTPLSDEELLTIAQLDVTAKYYPNLYSFQTSLNLDLVDTEDYWTFFIDI